MTGPAVPPPPPPPHTPPPPPPPPAAPPGHPVAGATHPSAMAGVEAGMASAEARASSALGGLSGPDSLIVGGAALFLIVGELLFGAIFGNSGNASVFGLGGISLQGVLAGEVLFFAWMVRPRLGRPGLMSAGAAQTVIGALVVAIVLFELAELILVVKNLSGFFNAGLFTILLIACRVGGAVLMGLGVVSAWSPTPSGGTAPPRA